jgi:hypothetical protein
MIYRYHIFCASLQTDRARGIPLTVEEMMARFLAFIYLLYSTHLAYFLGHHIIQ